MSLENQNQVRKLSNNSLLNGQSWTPDEKRHIGLAISRTFDLQKPYGKTAGQLKNVVEGFLWALNGYPMETVISALGQYILSHSDMPTPFDLVNIISPKPPEWKPDRDYYNKLKKLVQDEGPYAIGTEEAKYMQKYEDYVRDGVK